ncbi:MAG: P-loop NTPase [Chitinispirillaceae bacterium]|nr:P-loop NTPase [Chitinispirillaceae bacterium]
MNDQAQRLRELARRHELTRAPGDDDARKPQRDHPPKSIAITSGKGGVGKSNVALFLAAAFAAAKRRTLLLDADLGLANVHILLGIAPAGTLAHVIDGACPLDSIITAAPGGFDLVPGASGIERMANLDPGRLAMLRREFSRIENRYDVLLVDTGAGIGSIVTLFGSTADLTLVVMTPEPTSFADAYAMVKVLNERRSQRIGVIVNMASSEREGTETFDRLNALVLKFLKHPVEHFGTLPYCREVAQYVRKQRLMLLEKGDSPFARRIQGMARRIGHIPVRTKNGFFERLWGRGRGDEVQGR